MSGMISSQLPIDVVFRIMYYGLYDGGEFSRYMQPDDISGDRIPFRGRQKSFFNTYATVSKDVYRQTLCLLWRCIFVMSAEELAEVLLLLEEGPLLEDIKLGEQCRRIEVRMRGAYDPSSLVALIHQTPNLSVFILRNESSTTPPPPRVRPVSIVDALCLRASKLVRAQFESPREEPDLLQVKFMLYYLQDLVTFHLDAVHVQPSPNDIAPINVPARSLEVLSIGHVARQFPTRSPFHRTGELLRCLSSPRFLPSLSTLYLYESSVRLHDFITAFAPRLSELGYHSGDRWPTRMPKGHLLAYCPSLTTVVCTVHEGMSAQDIRPVPYHPTVQTVVLAFVSHGGALQVDADCVVLPTLNHLCGYGGALRRVLIVAPAHMVGYRNSPAFRSMRRRLSLEGVKVYAT